MITRTLSIAAHLLGIVLLMLPAALHAQPSVVAAEAYVRVAGFAPVDLPALQARIPALSSPFLTPPEIADLMLEARESKTVWRARTMVRMERRLVGPDVLDMIEIERFNLARAIREQTIRSFGSAAELEAFGTGAHVAWRIVTRSGDDGRAVIMAAGRRDYPEYEARDRDCLGLLCTSIETRIEAWGRWKQVRQDSAAPAPSPYPAIVTHSDGNVDNDDESIPHAIRALAVLAGLASAENGLQWKGPPTDRKATMMIDNEVGNGDGSDAIVGPLPGASGQWVRRASIANPGPQLTVTVYEGTRKSSAP
jgi:hypothetical protein